LVAIYFLTMAFDRLRKELVDVNRDSDLSGVSAEPVGERLDRLLGRLRGPADSVYEGGVFDVEIDIPREYPFAPPKMKFATRIWHPNVSSVTGAICLSTLRDDWSPALTLKTTLLSLQALLSAPEPDDPQDAEVAAQYKRNRKEWEATARFWTETYAAPPSASGGGGASAGVEQLVAMGFPAVDAERALRAKGGNVEQALELLFAGGGK
jgi:ubiquitin-conjugating enzyme (huntingtin interacting protein 2)